MNRSLSFVVVALAWGLVGQVFAGPCDGINFDTVIFREDFDSLEGVPPDSEGRWGRWVVNHPESWWWVQGRTFFPSPTYHPAGPFPYVRNGVCVFEHYQYNPYHLATPKTTFLGGEIHTVMEFEPTQCYRFEAKVRWAKDPSGGVPPRGLVTSFFTYGYDVAHGDSDEIDFEYLSNEVFDPPRQVLTNTWDDSQQKPVQVVMADPFDLTEWQIFRIYWCPDPCVKWTWINPSTGEEELLRTETDPAYIPDEPMQLYFNFWAATAGWPKAYDANLHPDQVDNGVYYEYWIDDVEVRVPEPASFTVLALGAAWLLRRRSKLLPSPHKRRSL